MKDEPLHQDFLPRSRGARILMALLALPSFLILTVFLIAIPQMVGPPAGVIDLLGMLLIGELLGLGALVSLLSLIWAAATPRWIADLIHTRVRWLFLVTGAFLVIAGGFLVFINVQAGQIFPVVVVTIGIIMGIQIFRKAPARRTRDHDAFGSP